MYKMTKKIFSAILILTALMSPGFSLIAQDAKETTVNENTKEPAETKEPEKQTFTMQGQEITIDQAIQYVIQENLTLKAAKYDVVMSDTQYNQFQKKFAPIISVEGSYNNTKFPASGMSAFTGTEQYQYDVGASIAKIFNTGTMVSVGVKHTLMDANDPPFEFNGITLKGEDPAYHKPNLYVMIQQELLKNSFGVTDRKTELMLENASAAQRDYLINLLSQLVVSALVDYWQVTIQKSALENAELSERSTANVRNIVARNIRFGLAELFDLNQYNALLASAEAQTAIAKQQLEDATRKLLRTVNMPPETKVEGITNLIDTLPEIDEEAAVQEAFSKRVDYKNVLREIEMAQLELDMAENNALPSLTASFQLMSQGQDTGFGSSWSEVPQLTYPAYTIGIKMSYPLWDKEIKTRERNANFKLKQAKIKKESMRQEIRDEVVSRSRQVKMFHEVLAKSREARKEADLFYARILRRIRQGKFNSVAMKNALDNMTMTRQKELEALVQYNVALLQLDLAKNVIFERYNVDIDSILAKIK